MEKQCGASEQPKRLSPEEIIQQSLALDPLVGRCTAPLLGLTGTEERRAKSNAIGGGRRWIECAFEGRTGAAAVKAESRSGKTYARYSVAVPNGIDKTEWVQVTAFDDVARNIADLGKGEMVYVEGKLRLNRWAPEDGDERANLVVVASRAVILGRIGRRKRPTKVRVNGRDARLNENAFEGCERQREVLDDPIPF